MRIYSFISTAIVIMLLLSSASLAQDSHLDKAEAFRSEGNYKKALKEYQKATKKNPSNAAALTAMGEMHLRLQEQEKAIGAFEKAISIGPQYADAYMQLANTYHTMDGRTEEAVELYEKAKVIDPGNLDAYFRLAQIYAGKENYHQAVVELEFVVANDSMDVEACWLLGRMYWMMDVPNKAVMMINQVIELNPHHIEAYFRLGYYKSKLAQHSEALQLYKRVATLRPADIRVYIAIGRLLYETGNFRKSIAFYQKTLDLQPSNTTAQFNIAMMHLCLGETIKAKELYQTAKHYCDAQELGEQLGAIEDLQELVQDGIQVEEANRILKEVFEIEGSAELSANPKLPVVPFYGLTDKPSEIKRFNPRYPEYAKRSGIEGTVVLKVLVGKNGNVESIEILKSAPMLDQAAIDAAWQFKFTPGKQGDRAVKVWLSIPFNFRLR